VDVHPDDGGPIRHAQSRIQSRRYYLLLIINDLDVSESFRVILQDIASCVIAQSIRYQYLNF
jgi:hypothetical protein